MDSPGAIVFAVLFFGGAALIFYGWPLIVVAFGLMCYLVGLGS